MTMIKFVDFIRTGCTTQPRHQSFHCLLWFSFKNNIKHKTFWLFYMFNIIALACKFWILKNSLTYTSYQWGRKALHNYYFILTQWLKNVNMFLFVVILYKVFKYSLIFREFYSIHKKHFYFNFYKKYILNWNFKILLI